MILWAIVFVVLCFGLVVIVGAPYLPTMNKQQNQALDLMNLKKGQTVLDLGSGDGRFLLTAAKQGYKAVGIELNPFLVVISYLLTYKYRKNVKIIWGDIWLKDWPKSDAIYVFLHTRFMSKLDKKILQQHTSKKVKVVSYVFKIPDKNIIKSKDALYFYIYK